jgi:hypothetical protein
VIPGPAATAPAVEPAPSAAPSRASLSSWRRSARPPSAAPAGPSTPPRRARTKGIGVLVGCNCSDTDYRPRGRPPNDPIGRCHRAPPIAKVLVSAMSLSCPIGRPWSSDTWSMALTCDDSFP